MDQFNILPFVSLDMLETESKRGRKVPVVLTRDIKDTMEVLGKKRRGQNQSKV